MEKIYSYISKEIINLIDFEQLYRFEPSRRMDKIYRAVKDLINSEKIVLNDTKISKIVKEIYEDKFEFGPVSNFLKNENITEIMINRWNEIYIEENGNIKNTPVIFKD